MERFNRAYKIVKAKEDEKEMKKAVERERRKRGRQPATPSVSSIKRKNGKRDLSALL